MNLVTQKAILGLITTAALTGTLASIKPATATTQTTTSANVKPIQVAIKEAPEAIKKAQEAADALKKAEDDLSGIIRSTNRAKSDANSRLNRAEQDFTQADAGFQTAQTALNTATNNRNNAQNALNTATNNRNNAQAEVDTATRNLAQARRGNSQKAIQNAINALNQANTRLNTANTALNTATNNFNTAIAELDQANTRLNTARNDFNTANSNFSRTGNELNTATNNFNTANNTFNTATTNFNNASSRRNTAEQARNQVREETRLTIENADSMVRDAQGLRDQAKLEADNAAKISQEAQEASKKANDWSTLTRNTIQDRSQDQNFQSLLPQFQALVQREGVEIPAEQIQAQKLDFSQLFLKNTHNVRVWFLNEGAGYRNQLAYEAVKGNQYNNGMIFEDVSCLSTRNKCASGNSDGVLDIGDFVDLGTIRGGTQLNFLLKGDGYNNPNGHIYGADSLLNPDGIQHIMAWTVGDYLMMGFEDLFNGGDKDYNDVMIVVDFGKNNFTTRRVPEPSATSVIMALGTVGMFKVRSRRKNK